jgi:hypothetical protein
MPDNLILTVSKDKEREKALFELLKSPPFDSFDSIIIYCTRYAWSGGQCCDFLIILSIK